VRSVAAVTRKNRPVHKGEPVKTKVSIAISRDELAWASAEAKRQRISVSAVFAASLRFVQRDAAWRRSLAAAGGTDDITDEDKARTDAEFREMGLIP
jgi:hypothetical protein